MATHELRTAGSAARLLVESDCSTLARDWDDVAHVSVTVVDADGTPCPWAEDLVTFRVEGPGVVLAVDNGDRASHEPFLATQRRVFQGRALALVRASGSPGRITLKAEASGLVGGTVTLEAIPGSF